MNPKERVLQAIEHQQPDWVPYQLDFTTPVAEFLQRYFGTADLNRTLGNHIFSVGYRSAELRRRGKEETGYLFEDEFGAVWQRHPKEDIGIVVKYPLEVPSLEGYQFPDPHAEGRFDGVAKQIEANPDLFIMGAISFSLFERAWTLRGFEKLLADFIQEPGFVDDLLDGILEFNLGIIDELSDFALDGFHFGDDWGQQHGLIMGPKLWRRYIKPRVEKMYAAVKRKGLAVSIHTCGDVRQIIPDLLDAGLDVLNPVQPEAMDVNALKSEFGDKLCFWGAISTQETLPYGTVEDVKAEVQSRIDTLGKDGGYILGPAHAIQKDVPLENILALIDGVRNQK